ASITVPPPAAPPSNPQVTRRGVHVDGDMASVDWTTDENVTATFELTGPVTRSLTFPASTEFRADLGTLEPGSYHYTITIATADGRTGSKEGGFAIAPH